MLSSVYQFSLFLFVVSKFEHYGKSFALQTLKIRHWTLLSYSIVLMK